MSTRLTVILAGIWSLMIIVFLQRRNLVPRRIKQRSLVLATEHRSRRFGSYGYAVLDAIAFVLPVVFLGRRFGGVEQRTLM